MLCTHICYLYNLVEIFHIELNRFTKAKITKTICFAISM